MLNENHDSSGTRRRDNDDHDLRGYTRDGIRRGDCRIPAPAGAGDAPGELTVRGDERRGLLWLVAAFVVCPCHLPITLALLAALFAGTGIETVRHGRIIVSAVTATVWGLATWRGLSLLRSANRTRPACERC